MGPLFESNIISLFRPSDISKSKNVGKHGIKRHKSTFNPKDVKAITVHFEKPEATSLQMLGSILSFPNIGLFVTSKICRLEKFQKALIDPCHKMKF